MVRAMDSGGGEVAYSCAYFRIYKDGRVDRGGAADTAAPAGFDAETDVTSKDVVIDAAAGVAARLYLPPAVQPLAATAAATTTTTKLPVLVFYHGGYFVVGSPYHRLFHRYVNSLAAAARVVAVSVRYRLAPEHRLPAAYDDSWAALSWVASGADPWLADHGDLGRVFLSGVSAGANIAHNMAIAAGVSGLPAGTAGTPARIEGVILLHPSFASEQRMEQEDEEFWRSNKDRWAVIFPGANGGLDDPRINPMAAGAPSLAKLAGERLLVSTASEDPRAPRGRAYCDAVRASGWRGELECFESQGGHGSFVSDHGSREAAKLMDRVADFLRGHLIGFVLGIWTSRD